MVRELPIREEEANSPLLRIFLSAGIFGSLCSTLVAALVLSRGQGDSTSFGDLLFWCGYFCLPAGLVAGALGGLWLAIVARRNPQRLGLILHGILTGIVLGLPLTLFFRQDHLAISIPVIVGASVGGSYALLFYPLLAKAAALSPRTDP